MNRTSVRQVLPILLAIALLWYVVKDVPVTALATQFRQTSYGWLALVGLTFGLYYLTRAARWQLTLQALGYSPSLFRTTIALLAGTLASMIIPGAGELTRCGTLQRTDGIPIAQGVGSVVAERVIDLLMLAGLIGLTLLLEFKRVGGYLLSLLSPLQLQITLNAGSGLFVAWAILISLLLLGILYLLAQTKTVQQHPLMMRLRTTAHDISAGFMSIRRLKRPGLFITLTLLSYVLAFFTVYGSFFTSPQTVFLPPKAALTILTVSSLGGLAVPTQGGLGTYHFLVSRALLLYSIPETESVIIATFLHAIGFGFNLLLSGISFLIVPMLIANRNARPAGKVVE